ncbi:DUF4349 domain-containing protein [Streptomyces sp. NPDC051776]|uniref:DUF4349 domain-containing protein n=1 Tax=Streptomyces sp. NPDC051776 TaxID=3155414 RepID=UPI00342A3266
MPRPLLDPPSAPPRVAPHPPLHEPPAARRDPYEPPAALLRSRSRSLAVLAGVLLTVSLGLTACAGSPDSATDRSAAKEGSRSEAGPAEPGAGRNQDAVPPNRAREGAADAGQQQPGTGDAKAPSRKPARLGPAHIIRTATLSVRVKDVSAAAEEARTTAENAGGYVGDETTDRDRDGHERSSIVLRVPQEEFGRVLDDLAGTGRLISRQVEAQDVTDQVVDVESRIKSQEASVARVRGLMDRAENLSDVVTLEGELSTRQAELEAFKAQRKSLGERTGMATITLRLSETSPRQDGGDDDETGFVDALSGGWGAFVATVRWLAVLVGAVLPFAAALMMLLVILRVARARMPGSGRRGVTPPAAVAVPGPARGTGTPAAATATATTGATTGAGSQSRHETPEEARAERREED